MPDPDFRVNVKPDWPPTAMRDRERTRKGRHRDEDVREARKRIDRDMDSTTKSMANMQILSRSSNQVVAAPTPSESVSTSATPTIARKPLQIAASSDKKLGSQPPTSPAAVSAKIIESPLMPQMKGGMKVIGEHLDFFDTINEYLSDANTNYTVISAVGSQGVGKSTILSMIGGNNAMDLYRQYVFRPSSREAIESSKFQTGCVSLYVTKNRTILIDMQALNSGGILDEAIRLNKSSKFDERLDTAKRMEVLQVLSFILHVSHTVLLCVDWFIDIEIIRTMRAAELLRANVPHVQISTHGALPTLSTIRKVNLVVIHCRAKASDFSNVVLNRRRKLLRDMFADSSRIKIPENDELAYFLTADLKLRKDPHGYVSSCQASQASERLFERNTVENIEVSLRRLRLLLAALPKEDFAKESQNMTEKQWFRMAKSVFSDSTFNGAAAKLAAHFT